MIKETREYQDKHRSYNDKRFPIKFCELISYSKTSDYLDLNSDKDSDRHLNPSSDMRKQIKKVHIFNGMFPITLLLYSIVYRVLFTRHIRREEGPRDEGIGTETSTDLIKNLSVNFLIFCLYTTNTF